MNIYLLRHGQAGDAAVDSERNLTPHGTKEVRQSCEGLARILPAPIDIILHSPLVRAVQTAEIAESVFQPVRGLQFCDALRPDGDFQLLSDRLASCPDVSEVMLVGHQPLLGELISHVLLGEVRIEFPLKTAGMAALELQRLGERGRLRWLLTSEQLAMLGQ